ncbi:hypothetical protein ACEWY4_010197 [Coilia grayii]|uniref:WH1 domain-containing protein n=1 Tax=Coilia grayii TaxID=363190 RepID=A0ABD1K995_9TELE
MSESSICQARAIVMIYDDASKRWAPAGTGAQSVSRLQIYHNTGNNSYRVVGRKMQADQQVVMNCPLSKGQKYNQATPNFHQWRDARQVWGLNFSTKEDASLFANSMTHALDVINGLSNTAPPPVQNEPSVEEQEEQKRLERQREEQQKLERERQASASTAPPAQPAAPAVVPPPPPGPPPPPPPPSSSAPAAPPPPGPPPPPGAGPPPPPPPPPPPSSGGGGGGGGLAEALAGAKLRKANRDGSESKASDTQSSAQGSSSGGGGGGGGGGGFMGEMSAMLARRRKVADNPTPPKEEPHNANSSQESPAPKFPPQNDVKKTWGEKSSTLPRTASTPRPQDSSSVSSSAVSRIKPANSTKEGCSCTESSLEKFKEEILEEICKELQNIKNEITQAVIQELQKNAATQDAP